MYLYFAMKRIVCNVAWIYVLLVS